MGIGGYGVWSRLRGPALTFYKLDPPVIGLAFGCSVVVDGLGLALPSVLRRAASILKLAMSMALTASPFSATIPGWRHHRHRCRMPMMVTWTVGLAVRVLAMSCRRHRKGFYLGAIGRRTKCHV